MAGRRVSLEVGFKAPRPLKVYLAGDSKCEHLQSPRPPVGTPYPVLFFSSPHTDHQKPTVEEIKHNKGQKESLENPIEVPQTKMTGLQQITRGS